MIKLLSRPIRWKLAAAMSLLFITTGFALPCHAQPPPQLTHLASDSACGDFRRVTWLVHSCSGTPTNRLAQAYDSSDLTQVAAADFLGRMSIAFTIQNGANAGNLEFTWAQNTSNGAATSVLAGSYIEWTTF